MFDNLFYVQLVELAASLPICLFFISLSFILLYFYLCIFKSQNIH